MKQQLADTEAVTDDAAAAVYVRNFGVALFQAADNDDRAGKATR
jgi:vacuolar protein sorting-associated protein VTA1